MEVKDPKPRKVFDFKDRTKTSINNKMEIKTFLGVEIEVIQRMIDHFINKGRDPKQKEEFLKYLDEQWGKYS